MFSISVEGFKETEKFKSMMKDLEARYTYVKVKNEHPDVPWFPETDEDLKNRKNLI